MSSTQRSGTETTLDRSRIPGPGPLRPFHFPEIQRRRLSNGLSVLVAQTDRMPVVTLSLLLRAGGAQEEAERAGLASLTSELLESGAAGRSAAEIAESFEALGVRADVGTSWDSTHVGLTALRSRIEAASEILADLVREPTFPEGEVERLREEQLAEILQRRADPGGLANEMAARYIFSAETPFSRPLGGTTGTVRQITRQDAAAFHRAHYAPGTATLLVAGDLSADEAVEIAEQRFGGWTGPSTEPARVEVQPRTTRPEIVVVDRPGSVQSELRVGHVGVARSTPDYFPILVMNAILGGAFSSRLNLNLRERHGFTYGVSSSFVMRRSPGPFVVGSAVQTEVTAAAVGEVLKEIRGIREEAVTERELADARNYLAGIFPLRLQTTSGVASRLAELVVYDLPEDYFDVYRDRIVAVSANEVLRAARESLHPDRLTVLVVGDAAKIRDSLEALDFGPVRVVSTAEDE